MADLMKTDFAREKALFQAKYHTTLKVEGQSAAIKRIYINNMREERELEEEKSFQNLSRDI